MSKIKISDVLHLAADKYLAKDLSEFYNVNYKTRHSCSAVQCAIESLVKQGKMTGSEYFANCDKVDSAVRQGFKKMGLEPNSLIAFDEFYDDYKISPESQGARYAWLKFAAMIAEEQGV
jgi:hypothetical protein